MENTNNIEDEFSEVERELKSLIEHIYTLLENTNKDSVSDISGTNSIPDILGTSSLEKFPSMDEVISFLSRYNQNNLMRNTSSTTKQGFSTRLNTVKLQQYLEQLQEYNMKDESSNIETSVEYQKQEYRKILEGNNITQDQETSQVERSRQKIKDTKEQELILDHTENTSQRQILGDTNYTPDQEANQKKRTKQKNNQERKMNQKTEDTPGCRQVRNTERLPEDTRRTSEQKNHQKKKNNQNTHEQDRERKLKQAVKQKNMVTPERKGIMKPRINLFKNNNEQLLKIPDKKAKKSTKILNSQEINAENIKLKDQNVPEETDLEILLINSCKIDVIKVQTVVEEFIRNKEYTSIFCFY